MEPRLADGLGLRFVDRTAKPGHAYLYRVYSLANNPDERIDTAFVVVSTAERDSTRSIGTLRVDEGERKVVLKWDRYEHAVPFSGYFIERSTDNGRTFSRINRLPHIPAIDEAAADHEGNNEISYSIDVEENYRPALYRVVGVDAFGETSRGSRSVMAMGRDRTAPDQPLMLPIAIDGSSVRLSWTVDSMEADLAGFQIGRSVDVDGYFEPIGGLLSRETRQYVDRDRRDSTQSYYAVYAVDTAGNVRSSVPLLAIFPDSLPPAVPMALEGTIDSNGVVTLRWRANEEPDLQGYRVFYANQTDHEFQQLTTDITADTMFADTLTLETLSEEIYYRVTALDRNFNHSEFTAVLMLKKPDHVAPAAPLVIETAPEERGVRLEWKRSPSHDVVEHTLYRRTAGDSAWQVTARSADPAFTSHTDTSAAKGVLYEYSLDARDDAGILSLRSNIVSAGRIESATRPPVDALTHTLDRTAHAIVLRWQTPADRTARIYLYKGTADGALALLQSIDATTAQYTDADIAAGGSYRYGVKVVSDDGRESSLITTGLIVNE
jgi:fibronectin type 3 domain-containing protein